MRSVNNLIEDLFILRAKWRGNRFCRKGRSVSTIATEIEGQALEGDFCVLQKSQTPWCASSALRFRVTRVAREVGTEGKLAGQANVKGVAGTWKDLTETSLDGR